MQTEFRTMSVDGGFGVSIPRPAGTFADDWEAAEVASKIAKESPFGYKVLDITDFAGEILLVIEGEA